MGCGATTPPRSSSRSASPRRRSGGASRAGRSRSTRACRGTEAVGPRPPAPPRGRPRRDPPGTSKVSGTFGRSKGSKVSGTFEARGRSDRSRNATEGRRRERSERSKGSKVSGTFDRTFERPLREDLVTQAALEAYGAVRHEGWLADRALDHVLRTKRHLYSNERRAVAERVYALLRRQRTVDALLERTGARLDHRPTTE